jgi:hypothetical protein
LKKIFLFFGRFNNIFNEYIKLFKFHNTFKNFKRHLVTSELGEISWFGFSKYTLKKEEKTL